MLSYREGSWRGNTARLFFLLQPENINNLSLARPTSLQVVGTFFSGSSILTARTCLCFQYPPVLGHQYLRPTPRLLVKVLTHTDCTYLFAFSVPTCARPSVPEAYSEATGYTAGATLTYTDCADGYSLKGTTSYTCVVDSDGNADWSPTVDVECAGE